MIEVTTDWSDVERELDRLMMMPTMKAKAALHAVLDFGFAQTQAAVHVESGALKASGKISVSGGGETWEGEIQYGGAGPVDYAIYEKRRGTHWVGKSAARGDHDFMRPLADLHPLWVEAMLEGLRK